MTEGESKVHRGVLYHMTIEEAGLEELPVKEGKRRKNSIICRQLPSRKIEAVFPAVVALVTPTHVHLSNYLAAWETDPFDGCEGLQQGLAYVFRMAWWTEMWELPDGRKAMFMEQIFDPDVSRYHFHELCRTSYDGERHRWNAHDAEEVQVTGRTHVESAGQMMWSMEKEQELLVKRSGSRAGEYFLPRGAYSWRTTRT